MILTNLLQMIGLPCPSLFFPVSATVLMHLTGTADCSFHLHASYVKIRQASTAICFHPCSDVGKLQKHGEVQLKPTYGNKMAENMLQKHCKDV